MPWRAARPVDIVLSRRCEDESPRRLDGCLGEVPDELVQVFWTGLVHIQLVVSMNVKHQAVKKVPQELVPVQLTPP